MIFDDTLLALDMDEFIDAAAFSIRFIAMVYFRKLYDRYVSDPVWIRFPSNPQRPCRAASLFIFWVAITCLMPNAATTQARFLDQGARRLDSRFINYIEICTNFSPIYSISIVIRLVLPPDQRISLFSSGSLMHLKPTPILQRINTSLMPHLYTTQIHQKLPFLAGDTIRTTQISIPTHRFQSNKVG